jgi:hypothetical protein
MVSLNLVKKVTPENTPRVIPLFFAISKVASASLFSGAKRIWLYECTTCKQVLNKAVSLLSSLKKRYGFSCQRGNFLQLITMKQSRLNTSGAASYITH